MSGEPSFPRFCRELHAMTSLNAVSSTHDDLDAHALAAVEELRTITDLVRWGAGEARRRPRRVRPRHRQRRGRGARARTARGLLAPRRARIAVRFASHHFGAPGGGRADRAPHPGACARPLPDGPGMVRGPRIRLRCARARSEVPDRGMDRARLRALARSGLRRAGAGDRHRRRRHCHRLRDGVSERDRRRGRRQRRRARAGRQRTASPTTSATGSGSRAPMSTAQSTGATT